MNFFSRRRVLFYSALILLACYFIPAYKEPVSILYPAQHDEKKVENAAPDLASICKNLTHDMQQITAQRTIFALEQINHNIRLCLPMMPFSHQKVLMEQADKMYEKFLYINRTPEQQTAFEQFALEQSQFPTIQQSHFEKLHLRDQYLLRHKGQAYIELTETSTGDITYRRNPHYLEKVFAPYFPDPEKEFMLELAKQNESSLVINGNLNILPQEIVNRALFWEKYTKKYPASNFIKDAHFLANSYRSLLFIGLPNSPVSDVYDGELDVQISNFMEIEALAKQKNSILAEQSRKFLIFIHMSENERTKKIKLSAKKLKSVGNDPHLLAVEQLAAFLNLTIINESDLKSRDCFSDAICH